MQKLQMIPERCIHSEGLDRVAEARVVLLGEGGAGKTSLIRRLLHERIRDDELATPRVEIRQQQDLIDGCEVKIHFWDFGGQVIMHATHQFFMREKSVYVVVLDIRRCDSLEYWLDHVRVFASGAPTLIVLNKIDSLPAEMATRPHFDLNKIRQRYPFVIDVVFPLSCKTDEGVEAFATELKRQIANNRDLLTDLPVNWNLIKEELAKVNRDFISIGRFESICHTHAVYGDDIPMALRALDLLGIAINFPTLQHNNVVLNPEWITSSIYYIIWASEELHLNGKLDVVGLNAIFAEAHKHNELDVNVPAGKGAFLLELMTEFKLAFRCREKDDLYCIPMLTQAEEPPHEVSREGGLQFVFSLPFLPPGLFYRFIAESGGELIANLIWKTGAILDHCGNRVLVEYSNYQRSITFIAHGPNAGVYLTVLRQRLIKILGESYKDLEFNLYIKTPDGELIDWREIFKRFAAESSDAKVYTRENEYKIIEILQEYFGGLVDNLLKSFQLEINLLFENNISLKNIITHSLESELNVLFANNINNENIVSKLVDENFKANVFTVENDNSSIEILTNCIDNVFDKVIGKLKEEIGLLFEKNREVTVMISNINKNDNSSINTVTSTNDIKQEVTIAINTEIQNLLHLDSNLEMVKELLDDFIEDEHEKAEEYKDELKQLHRDIERIRNDIEKVKAQSGATDEEKKPTMNRIKERWDNFADRAKQCYYVTGMAEKIAKAASWIGAIDWDKWLS